MNLGILAIDPSLRCTGVAIMLVTGNKFHTRPQLEKLITLAAFPRKGKVYLRELVDAIQEHSSAHMGMLESNAIMCIETPVYGLNASALINQSMLIGMLLEAFRNLPTILVHPMHTKSFLGITRRKNTIYKKDTKDEMVKKVKEIIGPKLILLNYINDVTKPEREAYCDAIAHGLTGAERYFLTGETDYKSNS